MKITAIRIAILVAAIHLSISVLLILSTTFGWMRDAIYLQVAIDFPLLIPSLELTTFVLSQFGLPNSARGPFDHVFLAILGTLFYFAVGIVLGWIVVALRNRRSRGST